jgi:riboflavin kinase / FMN adenylyltransferase
VLLDQELAGFQDTRDSVVTIGVFDGVHLGHKYLINQLKELARQQDLHSVVITFHKHPQEVLAPHSQPPFLTDAAEKTDLLKREGVDSVIVLTFTKKFSRLGAREFLNLLKSRLNMRSLVIGPDFSLGRDNEGDIPTLRQLGKEMGFTLTVVPPTEKNGEIVSSTAIRKALAEGNMEKVRQLMGRCFSLHGKVIRGKGRGTNLGFPTANLNLSPGQAVPDDGVYLTLVHADGHIFRSLTNVGTNPTFDGANRTVESHLFDLSCDLYGREIKVEFIRKLRNEVKFINAEELIRQINKDIQQAKELLKVEATVDHG